VREAISLTSPKTNLGKGRRGKKKKKDYRVGLQRSIFHMIEPGIKIYQTKLCV